MFAFDDEEFPLATWAAERDVSADPHCVLCWGEGDDDGKPCPCLVLVCVRTFAEAFEQAEPAPDCPRCEGTGEDVDGLTCPCMMTSLRAAQERLEISQT